MLLGIAGAAALVDWWAVAHAHRALEHVAKPATLALLVAVALVLHPAQDAVRWWVVGALVLSLAGDVFLMLAADLFVAGLTAFLAGHVCYIVGLQLEQRSWWLLLAGVVTVAVGVALVGRRIVAAVHRGDDPALLGPVVVYIVAISVMVISAWGTAVTAAVVGAVLFYASDATLAWNRFVAPLRRADLAIMVTYHLAQAALVLSLAVR